MGTHLRPECTISTSKRGETPVIFVLAVLGAHSRPECTMYTPKRGDTLVNFALVFLGTHLRPEPTISNPKRGETLVILKPLWELSCGRNALFSPIKGGKCSSHGCGPVQIQGPSSKALLMNSRLAGVGSWWCGVEMRYASACQGFPHIDPIPLRSHTTNINFDDPLLPSLRDTF